MRIGLSLVLFLALLVSPLCASETRQELSEESTLAQVIGKNKLRVGFSTFVPWAMKDKKGGYTGFEIEVARQLAADMGVEIQFVPTKWSGIIPALLTGKFDIIIGGMGITPERNLKVNFTNPYEFTGMSIVASAPLPAYLVVDNPNTLYLPLDETFTKEPIGFAIRKGDIDFLNFLNNWILVKNADGWLQERYDYWFTTQNWKDQVE